MTRIALSVWLVSLIAAPQPSAPDLVRGAIEAMGGEALKNIRSLAIDGMGHEYAIEQSERPEGPFMVTYQQISEIRDHERTRLWRKQEQRNWSIPNWTGPAGLVFADGVVAINAGTRWGPHQPQQLARMSADMALSPERLLLTALAAADLRTAPDRALHGIQNRAVAFTHGGVAFTLYLSLHTGMPTMLASVEDDAFGIWGDVTRERWYTFWTLQPGGWRYPQQITTTWNGLPFSDQTIFTVRANGVADEALFAIPEDTKAMFRKLAAQPTAGAMGLRSARLDVARAIQIADDIVLLPGSWHVTLVRQPDGIVVLEAPIGSHYSIQVIDAAAQRFPGVPIKAVVTTSDAWPHLGGVREYVARGIPVYALDLNLPILQRVVAAKHAASPDALQRTPATPVFRAISQKTTIGSGSMRLDVIPVRGEGSERMLMVALPERHLLYASDLLQYNRDRTGFFHPVYPAELAAAVTREGLSVERAWAMHMEPIPWSRITEALAALGVRR
jgi:hypothetical protein